MIVQPSWLQIETDSSYITQGLGVANVGGTERPPSASPFCLSPRVSNCLKDIFPTIVVRGKYCGMRAAGPIEVLVWRSLTLFPFEPEPLACYCQALMHCNGDRGSSDALGREPDRRPLKVQSWPKFLASEFLKLKL